MSEVLKIILYRILRIPNKYQEVHSVSDKPEANEIIYNIREKWK